MGKNKLKRFEEIAEFENTLELTDFQDNNRSKPRGRWNTDIFENNFPITLELACGKGEYALELARQNPRRNFVGVDIKGARIWKGAKQALKQEIDNVRFLRIYIDHLHEYFATAEVDEIWITFPDPYENKSDENNRLTCPKFMDIYKQVLKPGGHINLKTDSDSLFEYTERVVDELNCPVYDKEVDIYANRPDDPILTVKTYYEKGHLENGKIIKYIEFGLPKKKIKGKKL